MYTVAIDPGKKAVGWALFSDKNLIQCGLVINEGGPAQLNAAMEDAFQDFHAAVVVVEVPQMYQQRFLKGDPNDLIDVALAAGMAVGNLAPCGDEDIELVRPRKWKGTRPKKVCNQLTLKTLTPAELAIYENTECLASLRHNVIDAIGIGLWKAGRR